jgi:hypothetical protein
MQNHNRFQRGSGVFACDICGRRTRNTGQPHDSRLCEECYELAGWENCLSDEGPETFLSYRKTVEGYLDDCLAKGGDALQLRKEFKPITDVLDW